MPTVTVYKWQVSQYYKAEMQLLRSYMFSRIMILQTIFATEQVLVMQWRTDVDVMTMRGVTADLGNTACDVHLLQETVSAEKTHLQTVQKD